MVEETVIVKKSVIIIMLSLRQKNITALVIGFSKTCF